MLGAEQIGQLVQDLRFTDLAIKFAESSAPAPLVVLSLGRALLPVAQWTARRGHSETSTDATAQHIELLRAGSIDREHGTRVRYELARAELLPFADASFDLVTCVSLFHHLAPGADRVALWEIARVLKPRGILVATVRMAAAQEAQPGEQPIPSDRRRFGAAYSLENLRRLLIEVQDCIELESPDLDGLEQLRIDQSEEHAHPERIGLILTRREHALRPSPAHTVTALLSAQAAVEEQTAYQAYHASERLRIIHELQRESRE
jgi:SAM-dependent methyltransferase